jgi:hypothetical protein
VPRDPLPARSSGQVVNIARCPEHGIHGERTECFVCEMPVEQVAMVEHERVLAACDSAISLAEHLASGSIEKYRWDREIAEIRALRNGTPLASAAAHRIETYKPRPRPEGETSVRIAAAVARPGGPRSKYKEESS